MLKMKRFHKKVIAELSVSAVGASNHNCTYIQRIMEWKEKMRDIKNRNTKH